MKTYTEKNLREAFHAGVLKGMHDQAGNYFDALLDEDEYIQSLNPKVEEDKISFTYSFLRIKLDWESFCDLTGTNFYALNEGFEFSGNEIYYIKESEAKKYNLL